MIPFAKAVKKSVHGKKDVVVEELLEV